MKTSAYSAEGRGRPLCPPAVRPAGARRRQCRIRGRRLGRTPRRGRVSRVGQLGVQPERYLVDYWSARRCGRRGAPAVVLCTRDDFFRRLTKPLRALPYAGDDLEVRCGCSPRSRRRTAYRCTCRRCGSALTRGADARVVALAVVLAVAMVRPRDSLKPSPRFPRPDCWSVRGRSGEGCRRRGRAAGSGGRVPRRRARAGAAVRRRGLFQGGWGRHGQDGQRKHPTTAGKGIRHRRREDRGTEPGREGRAVDPRGARDHAHAAGPCQATRLRHRTPRQRRIVPSSDAQPNLLACAAGPDVVHFTAVMAPRRWRPLLSKSVAALAFRAGPQGRAGS